MVTQQTKTEQTMRSSSARENRLISRRRWQQMRKERRSIDLGGGYRISPEDVLESHFRQIAGPPIVLRTQDVGVQVTPNLHTAIRVVAPTLAPLAQIAEELTTRMPTVQPAANFRSELHMALEEAHRVQTAQRIIAAARARSRRPRLVALAASAIVALGLAGAALWLLRKRPR